MLTSILRASAVVLLLSGLVLSQDGQGSKAVPTLSEADAEKLAAALQEVYGTEEQTQPISPDRTNGNTQTETEPQISPQIQPQIKPQTQPTKKPGIVLNPTKFGEEDKSCMTDDNQPGECVQYYLCSANNSIITDGLGIIDIRARDGPCVSYLEVCCLPPDRVSTPITPPPPVQPIPTGCGYRNPDGVQMRIKGDVDGEARFGEFNWMLAVLREEPVEGSGQKLNVYQCGGSLIHPQIAMTAAHCVHALLKSKQIPKLKVRAGEWDTQTKDEILPHQDREVTKIIEHNNYVDGVLFNDVALLFLDKPLTLAGNIGIVCLPEAKEEILGSTRCFASGWGKDIFGKEGRYQVILKKVELPIMARSECQAALRTTRLGKHYILNPSFICAGGEHGKDTCKGDGGSPLVCPIQHEKERYVQAGIVSWGIGCGEDNIPGVYTNIPLVREWIDETVVREGFQIDSYRY